MGRIDADRFVVRKGANVRLAKWPTEVKPFYRSTEDYQEILAARVDEMSNLQHVLYADNRYALLVILQAMDAAGKDGLIRHVFSGLNPQGCQVSSFKHPSATELEHDFLWRTTACLPERGSIGVFNRSYYEEVLIVRVHPELLRAEGVPDGDGDDGEDVWSRRFGSIVDFEHHLRLNGTRIVKFFLHLSKDEQRKRFLGRIDEAEKNWKFSVGDIHERGYWKQYMKAYGACLSATSAKHAPWYAVPADDKRNARLIVAQALVDTLKSMKLHYPLVDDARRRELRAIRRQLIR